MKPRRRQVSFQSQSPQWSRRSPPSSCGGCSSWEKLSSAPPWVPLQRCRCCCCQGSQRSGRFCATQDKKNRFRKKNRRQTQKQASFIVTAPTLSISINLNFFLYVWCFNRECYSSNIQPLKSYKLDNPTASHLKLLHLNAAWRRSRFVLE